VLDVVGLSGVGRHVGRLFIEYHTFSQEAHEVAQTVELALLFNVNVITSEPALGAEQAFQG
jgi:hypothetical protein